MALPKERSCHGAGQEPGRLLAHRGLCCSTESSPAEIRVLCSSRAPGASSLSQPHVLRPGSWRRLPCANHSSLSKPTAPAGNSPLGSALGDPSGKGGDGMGLLCPFKGDNGTRASPLPLQRAKPGLGTQTHQAHLGSALLWILRMISYRREGKSHPTWLCRIQLWSHVCIAQEILQSSAEGEPCLVQGEIKIHHTHK